MARSLTAALVAVTIASAAFVSATGARADATGSALFRLRAVESRGESTRTLWTNSPYQLDVDPSLRARWSFDAMTALPVTESRVSTYDVKPLLAAVTYKTLFVSTVQLTFITSRSLMVANLGNGASLSVDPKSVRSGAVTFSVAF